MTPTEQQVEAAARAILTARLGWDQGCARTSAYIGERWPDCRAEAIAALFASPMPEPEGWFCIRQDALSTDTWHQLAEDGAIMPSSPATPVPAANWLETELRSAEHDWERPCPGIKQSFDSLFRQPPAAAPAEDGEVGRNLTDKATAWDVLSVANAKTKVAEARATAAEARVAELTEALTRARVDALWEAAEVAQSTEPQSYGDTALYGVPTAIARRIRARSATATSDEVR